MGRRAFLTATTAIMIHPSIDEFFRRAQTMRAEHERALNAAFAKEARDASLYHATKALANADVAILLAGEDEDRIEFFVDTYDAVMAKRKEPLHIICSGGHAGFTDSKPSQAFGMATQLLEKGIRNDDITIERESRDTIANAVYSNKILTPSERKVTVITSGYHRARADAFMRQVIGPQRTVTSASTPKQGTRTDVAREVAVRGAVWLDTLAIADGDSAAWDAYLQEKHPFHAPYHGNTPSGLYTRIARSHVPNFDATVERIVAESKR